MKDGDVIIEAMRLEFMRWRTDLETLKVTGQPELVAKIEGWIKRGEDVLRKWDAV